MNMANGNSKVLTAEQEMQIRRPIEEYVGAIQKQIDGLRVDGTQISVVAAKHNGRSKERSHSYKR